MAKGGAPAVQFGIDGDATGAINELRKLQVEQEKVIKQLREQMKESRRAAKEAGGLGSALAGVGKHIAGFASIGAIGSAMANVLNTANQISKSGQQSFLSQEDQMKAFAQIADKRGGSVDMNTLRAQSTRMRSIEGMNAASAAELVFQAYSTGREKELGLFGAVSRFADPNVMMDAVDKIHTAMGRGETGSTRTVLNKLLVAGKESTLRSDALAPNLLSAAGKFSENKWNDESLFGAMGALANAQRSPEMVGTGLRGFAITASKELKNAGGSLMGAYQQFSSMSPAKLKKLLDSSAEFSAGYNMISQNVGRIQDITGKVSDAQMKPANADMLSDRLRVVHDDSWMQTMRTNRIEAERLLMDDEKYGREEAAREAKADAWKRRSKSLLGRSIRGIVATVFDPFNIEQNDPIDNRLHMRDLPRNPNGKLMDPWTNVLKENTRALQRRADLGSE